MSSSSRLGGEVDRRRPRRAASAGRRPRRRGSDRPRRRRTRRGTGGRRSAGRRRGCRRASRTRRGATPCRRGGRRARRAAPRPRRGRARARRRRGATSTASASPAASGCSAPRTDAVTTSGVVARPAGDAPEHVEAVPDGLGARAQPLVRQRLPRREVHDLGAGQERLERGAERFGAAPGRARSTNSAPARPAARRRSSSDGQQRGVEALDEREVGVDGCRGRGIPERLRLFEGAHDPGNCHRTSLRAPADTRSPAPERIGARLVG